MTGTRKYDRWSSTVAVTQTTMTTINSIKFVVVLIPSVHSLNVGSIRCYLQQTAKGAFSSLHELKRQTQTILSSCRLAVDMKLPIHIHIHRRLSCVHIATKFSQNTAVQERPPLPPQKNIRIHCFFETDAINKYTKNKHICIEM